MSLPKDCADHLRSNYKTLTGKKLGSGHAHELVAAFFGYGTAAALQAEARFPLDDLAEAEFLIPDLHRMDQRISQIRGLPVDLPTMDELASTLCAFLMASGHFTGEVWQARDLSDHIEGFVHRSFSEIEEGLSGEIASTNAYFDEIQVDKSAFEPNDDALAVTVEGSLEGENDPDRSYHGDRILFVSALTFDRVSGRIAYRRPEFDTGGRIDDEGMYDQDL